MLRELRSVVGLQELLYVIFCIEDFAVYTVVWEIALVAVVLCGADSGMRRGDFPHSSKLLRGHSAYRRGVLRPRKDDGRPLPILRLRSLRTRAVHVRLHDGRQQQRVPQHMTPFLPLSQELRRKARLLFILHFQNNTLIFHQTSEKSFSCQSHAILFCLQYTRNICNDAVFLVDS